MTRELAVLATIALTFSTGCTVAVPTPATTSPPEATPPDTSASSRPPTTVASATPQEPVPTTAPVAEREAAQADARVRADVFPIKRESKGTVVTVRLTVLSGQDSRFLHGLTTDARDDSPQTMRIVDTAAGTVHLPSEADRPVCGPSVNRNVSSGDIIWASCVFGPLPATTQQVALQFGPFGSFDAIPVR